MIWIIGGTVNANDICRLLVSAGRAVLVSVTTDHGRQLSELAGAEVHQGVLNENEMAALIVSKGIQYVVDASHPFATEVSHNAMTAAQRLCVPYTRFERQNPVFEGVTYVKGYAEAVTALADTQGNILLTTGSKHIVQFVSLGCERLFARVLSCSASMAQCEAAGLKPAHIIGMSGVCSVDLNSALLKQFSIQFLVTKESGDEGGLREKVEAARINGVQVVIIQRPAIHYPEVYSDYQQLVLRLTEIIG